MEIEFDVEDFKNGDFLEIKALSNATIDAGEEERFVLCCIINERVNNAHKVLEFASYGDLKDDKEGVVTEGTKE